MDDEGMNEDDALQKAADLFQKTKSKSRLV
jgi:hypothetical protein